MTSRNIILYIGKAQNIRERWNSSSHHRLEQLLQFENPQIKWLLTDEINATEVVMIKQFNPLLNGLSVLKKPERKQVNLKPVNKVSESFETLKQEINVTTDAYKEVQSIKQLESSAQSRFYLDVFRSMSKDVVDLIRRSSNAQLKASENLVRTCIKLLTAEQKEALPKVWENEPINLIDLEIKEKSIVNEMEELIEKTLMTEYIRLYVASEAHSLELMKIKATDRFVVSYNKLGSSIDKQNNTR